MISLPQVEQIERMLADGVPKLQISRTLGLSKDTIQKVAAGQHPLQTAPSAEFERYQSRQTLPPQRAGVGHTLETVERIEALLAAGVSKRAIWRMTGVKREVVRKIAAGAHFRKCTPERWAAYKNRADKHDPFSTKPIETVRQIEELLADGVPKAGVQRSLNISERTVSAVAAGKHFRQLSPEAQAFRAQYMRRRAHLRRRPPSPRLIGKLCAEIRRTWTRAERENRWCGPSGWTPPCVGGAA